MAASKEAWCQATKEDACLSDLFWSENGVVQPYRNLYTRAKEHLDNYRKERPKSFMRKHQNKKHGGLPGRYKARVTGSYADCLSRQVMEGVNIRRCQVEVLNGKSEWHQPPLWQVQNELYRG